MQYEAEGKIFLKCKDATKKIQFFEIQKNRSLFPRGGIYRPVQQWHEENRRNLKTVKSFVWKAARFYRKTA